MLRRAADHAMPEPLEEWLRPHFDPSVGRPFLFYVAYGKTPDDFAISRSRYKFGGVPDGLEISAYGPTSSPETVDDFRTNRHQKRNQPRIRVFGVLKIFKF